MGDLFKTQKKDFIPETAIPYKTIPRETLTGVAIKFGMQVSQLKTFNGLFSDRIFPKQILYIPQEYYRKYLESQESQKNKHIINCGNDSNLSSNPNINSSPNLKSNSNLNLNSNANLSLNPNTNSSPNLNLDSNLSLNPNSNSSPNLKSNLSPNLKSNLSPNLNEIKKNKKINENISQEPNNQSEKQNLYKHKMNIFQDDENLEILEDNIPNVEPIITLKHEDSFNQTDKEETSSQNFEDDEVEQYENIVKESVFLWVPGKKIPGVITLTPHFFIYEPTLPGKLALDHSDAHYSQYFFHAQIHQIVDSLIIQPPQTSEDDQHGMKILQIVLLSREAQHFIGGAVEIEKIHEKVHLYIDEVFHDHHSLVNRPFPPEDHEIEMKKKKFFRKMKDKWFSKSKKNLSTSPLLFEFHNEISSDMQQILKKEKKDVVAQHDEAEKAEKAQEIEKILEESETIEKEQIEFKVKLDYESEILNEERIESIHKELPKLLQKLNWELLYSTGQHGTAISTFFTKTKGQDDIIICFENEKGEVFGTYLAVSLKQDPHYYGSGRMFLFTFYPHFQVFRWTRRNSFFVLSTKQTFAFGGGSHYGIWFNKNLYEGASDFCETFNNPQLCSQKRFMITRIEIWKIGKKKIIKKKF